MLFVPRVACVASPCFLLRMLLTAYEYAFCAVSLPFFCFVCCSLRWCVLPCVSLEFSEALVYFPWMLSVALVFFGLIVDSLVFSVLGCCPFFGSIGSFGYCQYEKFSFFSRDYPLRKQSEDLVMSWLVYPLDVDCSLAFLECVSSLFFLVMAFCTPSQRASADVSV